jgi:hypothetical protein
MKMSKRRRTCSGLLFAALLALGGTRAKAMSLLQQNIVDLLADSELIVTGTVENVTDGIDSKGVPYTEVTLTVSEAIRGDVHGTYSFRQFGLVDPRPTADGRMLMMPAPDGFPRYTPGEDVVLFLRPRAAWTGLRTTSGLAQGKFTVGPGRLENGTGNTGLFRDVTLAPGLSREADRRLLTTASGTLNPEAFLSFVRRAVAERWVETGRMTRTGGARPIIEVPPASGQRGATEETPASPTAVTAPKSLSPNANVVTGRNGQ